MLTATSVLSALKKLYKPPRTFLAYRTPLDLTVATILSAQCTDDRVNTVVTETLYPKYRTPDDYVAVSRQELESEIYSCGTYRNKARFIQEMCQLLIDRFGGEVPRTLDELITLPGIGRKTAAIITYAAYDNPEAVAVDTHVIRVSRRLGLSKQQNPDKISLDL
ncbi:MAG: endonuclease III, partial [Candidatus Peregrinibacteria bacterium]|nr:endonuclease III [Candidatus Peregrinibacteria bacterium]